MAVNAGLLQDRWGEFATDDGLVGNFSRLQNAGVVARILAKLSIDELFKLRQVCKSWYDAVLSPRYTRLLHDTPTDPWAVLFSSGGMAIWRPVLGSYHPTTRFSNDMQGLCSAGGLVCYKTKADPQVVYVFNPMTLETRVLPLLQLSMSILGGYMSKAVDSYELVLILSPEAEKDNPGVELIAWHLHSVTGLWTGGGDRRMNDLGNTLRGSACYMDDALYAYDLPGKAWTASMVDSPTDVYIISAFEYNGVLYTAGSVTEELGHKDVLAGVGIWRVAADDQSFRLLPVSSFPNTLSGNRLSLDTYDVDMEVKVVGGTVLFFCSRGGWFPEVFDLELNRWFSLLLNNLPDDIQDDVQCAFVFQPNLGARV